jgi:hypothetical protein
VTRTVVLRRRIDAAIEELEAAGVFKVRRLRLACQLKLE